MTATAVYENCSSRNEGLSPITVSYVLYSDDSVERLGLKSEMHSRSVYWPFSLDEAKILLQAQAKGLVFGADAKTVG